MVRFLHWKREFWTSSLLSWLNRHHQVLRNVVHWATSIYYFLSVAFILHCIRSPSYYFILVLQTGPRPLDTRKKAPSKKFLDPKKNTVLLKVSHLDAISILLKGFIDNHGSFHLANLVLLIFCCNPFQNGILCKKCFIIFNPMVCNNHIFGFHYDLVTVLLRRPLVDVKKFIYRLF